MVVVMMPVAAMPIAAAPALATVPRAHSGTAPHSGAPSHETMAAAAAATVRCGCENWRTEHQCSNATQQKQKFRIIHNR
jgi:hypothetical protein